MKKFYEFIEEMARNIGEPFSPLDKSEDQRKTMYSTNSNFVHHSYPISDNKSIELTKYVDANKNTTYSTNDHTNKEVLHYSNIKCHNPTKSIPFEHEEQHTVERVKGDKLPKEYATNMIYDHFKKSNIPLKSSNVQYRTGHNMWRKLAHKALEDGHHVYYHDGTTLHKSTKDNVDQHLDSSFGKEERRYGKTISPDYETRHMILSKHKL